MEIRAGICYYCRTDPDHHAKQPVCNGSCPTCCNADTIPAEDAKEYATQ